MALTKKDLKEIKNLINETLDGRELRDAMATYEAIPPENGFDRWEKEDIKTKVGVLAPENFKLNGKEHFTWGEAMALELPDGWRLPTMSEWAMICEEFGKNDKGYLTGDALSKALNLPFTGYYDSCLNAQGSVGYYWSSTASSSTIAYSLYYNSGNVNPASSSSKYYGFAVRLIKGDNQ